MSLGIFLWAWPVGQVLWLWIPNATPSPDRFAVLILLTLALAWLSSRYIEAPALRLKPAKPASPALAAWAQPQQ